MALPRRTARAPGYFEELSWTVLLVWAVSLGGSVPVALASTEAVPGTNGAPELELPVALHAVAVVVQSTVAPNGPVVVP